MNQTMPIKIAFPPIIDQNCRILLLGTMPGERSLQLGQYYGHAGNHFWKLIFGIFDLPASDNYAVRTSFLLENGIALWDVLESCTGVGSLDSQIRNATINDFRAFYQAYPKLEHIFFDSRKAEEFYRKKMGFSPGKTYHLLPSPSRANAGKTFEQKLEAWKELLLYI